MELNDYRHFKLKWLLKDTSIRYWKENIEYEIWTNRYREWTFLEDSLYEDIYNQI